MPKITRYIWFLLALLLLILLGSLRWNTGADWRPYSRFYAKSDLDDPLFILSMESGFAYFVGFLRQFSESFTFYLTALSLLTISLKGIFLLRFTKATFLAVILYWGVTLGDIVAVRQAIAISICCIGVIFIVKEKPLIFGLLVLLAMQFHTTSVIFFLAYPVYYMNWSITWKVLSILIAIFLGLNVGYEVILEKVINLVPSGLGLDRLTQKAESYKNLGNEFFQKDETVTLTRLVAALAKRAVLLPVFFYFQSIYKENRHYNGFLNLYTLGNVIFFLFVDFSVLQRAATTFYFFEIILFCFIFENTKSKGIWFVIILAYAFMKMASNIFAGYDLLVPYIWIFSDDTYRYMY
ncbi:EpsG family protein [Pseudopedobacter sp.]|uniref:EpsG family protein n=1 Tax=Pseudopedobacter sp. TaxID=1936787 RepID=UPI00333EDFD2